jgi:hypothetical protein
VARVKPSVWIAIVFAVLVFGAIVISTFRTERFRCRVCITFRGNSDCRTASAQTREEAQRTATVAACAQLSGGITDSNQCQNTTPDSIEWLQ